MSYSGNVQMRKIVRWKGIGVCVLLLVAVMFSNIGMVASFAEAVSVDQVVIVQETLELKTGEEGQLSVAVIPEDASNKNVVWTSDDSDIATVDADGKVKAIKKGVATITVTSLDGEHSASCVVMVTGINLNFYLTIVLMVLIAWMIILLRRRWTKKEI